MYVLIYILSHVEVLSHLERYQVPILLAFLYATCFAALLSIHTIQELCVPDPCVGIDLALNAPLHVHEVHMHHSPHTVDPAQFVIRPYCSVMLTPVPTRMRAHLSCPARRNLHREPI